MNPAVIKPEISFKAFEKIDVRVGTIKRVEEIKEADELVRLIVSFGDHERTILAGIKKEREDPGELQGMQALFVVNLAPRKMMGEYSEGMVLAADDGRTLAVLSPQKEVIPGAKVS